MVKSKKAKSCVSLPAFDRATLETFKDITDKASENAIAKDLQDQLCGNLDKIDTQDSLEQISAIKSLGTRWKEEGTQSEYDRQILLDSLAFLFVKCKAKHPMRKTLMSIFQSLPEQMGVITVSFLCRRLLEELDVFKFNPILSEKITYCSFSDLFDQKVCTIMAFMENFSLGKNVIERCTNEVLSVLYQGFVREVQQLRKTGSYQDQTLSMMNCLSALKATVAVLQCGKANTACQSQSNSVLFSDKTVEILLDMLRKSLLITQDSSYLLDCRNTAAVTVVSILQSLLSRNTLFHAVHMLLSDDELGIIEDQPLHSGSVESAGKISIMRNGIPNDDVISKDGVVGTTKSAVFPGKMNVSNEVTDPTYSVDNRIRCTKAEPEEEMVECRPVNSIAARDGLEKSYIEENVFDILRIGTRSSNHCSNQGPVFRIVICHGIVTKFNADILHHEDSSRKDLGQTSGEVISQGVDNLSSNIGSVKPGIFSSILLQNILHICSTVNEKGATVFAFKTLYLWSAKALCHCKRLEENKSPDLELFAPNGEISPKIVETLNSYLDHPIDAVRHQVRNTLENIIQIINLFPDSLNHIQDLLRDWIKGSLRVRSNCMALSCLIKYVNIDVLLQSKRRFPQALLDCLDDANLVSHICDLYVKSATKHISETADHESGFLDWLSIWCKPIFENLVVSHRLKRSAILEYIVPGLLIAKPDLIRFIIEQSRNPDSGKDYVVTAVVFLAKVRNLRECSKTKLPLVDDVDSGGFWHRLIHMKSMRLCLCHSNEQVRIEALSLICESNKTTEPLTEQDLELLQFFIPLNMTSQSPQFRNHFVSCMKKAFSRMVERSKALTKRINDLDNFKSKEEAVTPNVEESSKEYSREIARYGDFITWLLEFLLDCLHPASSFARRNSALETLSITLRVIHTSEQTSHSFSSHVSKVLTKLSIQTFVNCLYDSYDVNKCLANEILDLLPRDLFTFSKKELSKIFEDTIVMAGSSQSDNTNTAPYFVEFLIGRNLEKAVTEVLLDAFAESRINPSKDECKYNVHLLIAEILMKNLAEQVNIAKANLLNAAENASMHGILRCIRVLLSNVVLKDAKNTPHWKPLLNKLIKLCFEVASIAGPVVSSSAPEGHVIADSADHNVLASQLIEELKDNPRKYEENGDKGNMELCDESGKSVSNLEVIRDERKQYIADGDELNQLIDNDVGKCDKATSGDSLRDNSTLPSGKFGSLTHPASNGFESSDKLAQSTARNDVADNESSKSPTNAVDSQAHLSQLLLACCWRSMKEIVLLLGDIASSSPVSDTPVASDINELSDVISAMPSNTSQSCKASIETNITDASWSISPQTVIEIARLFINILLSSRHIGAFELAYPGFVKVCFSLWRSNIPVLKVLPNKWVDDLLFKLKQPDTAQIFCATRRSAGIPFFISAICSTEPGIPRRKSFNEVMKVLLEICRNASDIVDDANSGLEISKTVIGLNVLRAMYKDTKFGEDVFPYVSDGFVISINGFSSNIWAIRNSCTLLFSALMSRVFGLKKTVMSGTEFFSRFSSLYPYLIEEMTGITDYNNKLRNEMQLHPSAFPVLFLLSHLYPSSHDGNDSKMSLASFIPSINKCSDSCVYKIRAMAADALVSIVNPNQLADVLNEIIESIPTSHGTVNHNRINGCLLKVKCLLRGKTTNASISSSLRHEILKGPLVKLNQITWILHRDNLCSHNKALLLEIINENVFNIGIEEENRLSPADQMQLCSLKRASLFCCIGELGLGTPTFQNDTEAFKNQLKIGHELVKRQCIMVIENLTNHLRHLESINDESLSSKLDVFTLMQLLRTEDSDLHKLFLSLLEKSNMIEMGNQEVLKILQMKLLMHDTDLDCLAGICCVMAKVPGKMEFPWVLQNHGSYNCKEIWVILKKRLHRNLKRERFRASVQKFAVILVSEMLQQILKEEDSGCDVDKLNCLEEMFNLVFDSCKPEENVHSREMAAEVMGSEEFLNVARVAAASTRLPLANLVFGYWRCIIHLLQDEDEVIRCLIARKMFEFIKENGYSDNQSFFIDVPANYFVQPSFILEMLIPYISQMYVRVYPRELFEFLFLLVVGKTPTELQKVQMIIPSNTSSSTADSSSEEKLRPKRADPSLSLGNIVKESSEKGLKDFSTNHFIENVSNEISGGISGARTQNDASSIDNLSVQHCIPKTSNEPTCMEADVVFNRSKNTTSVLFEQAETNVYIETLTIGHIAFTELQNLLVSKTTPIAIHKIYISHICSNLLDWINNPSKFLSKEYFRNSCEILMGSYILLCMDENDSENYVRNLFRRFCKKMDYSKETDVAFECKALYNIFNSVKVVCDV